MSGDYSISLNGVLAAERNLEQAARRIATVNLPATDNSDDWLSLSDLAADLLAVDLAKTAEKANLRVLFRLRELDREVFNLLIQIRNQPRFSPFPS